MLVVFVFVFKVSRLGHARKKNARKIRFLEKVRKEFGGD
jgi:hypothetical protein